VTSCLSFDESTIPPAIKEGLCLRYVIEEKCNMLKIEVPNHENYHFFNAHGLGGVFDLFGQSPFEVINHVYPSQFQPWEFANTPINFWDKKDNIEEAMEWLLFKKLNFSTYHEAYRNIRKVHFLQHGLSGFLQTSFNHRLFLVREWIVEQIEVKKEKIIYDG
jgi:hypothetical protein